MLGEEDKRWLEKVLDQRFNAQDVKIEERFAAQDVKIEERFTAQDAKIEERFAAQDAKIEERFAAQDAKIEERFAAQDVKIEERFAAQDVKIEERFAAQDAKIEERFAVQDAKIEERFAVQDEKSERQNASLRQELNRVMDQKAAVFRRGMREEIERSEERIIRHFDIIYENRILPMIEEHIAVLPGEGQSYELLEERVRKVEDDISVMKVAMAARV